MWALTPKRVTCFSTDPLDLYNLDSACPEVFKYLNYQGLGILVSEKTTFEVWLVLPGGPASKMCTNNNVIVITVMHNEFDQKCVRTFKVDAENMNFP